MSILGIVGVGGHAKVVYDIATSTKRFERIFGLDRRYPQLNRVGCIDVLGSDHDVDLFALNNCHAVIAVGDNSERARLFDWLRSECVAIAPALVSPRAYISPSASCEEGSIVAPMAVVGADTCIGCNTIVNTGAIVEHDVSVAAHCHIAPGSVLCGGVVLGSGVFIGAGAVVLPTLTIGRNAIIGAGAVVTRDIEEGSVVRGVPGRTLVDGRSI